jgi:hypothetical protein
VDRKRRGGKVPKGDWIYCFIGAQVQLGGGGDVIGGAGQVTLEQLQPDQTATDDRFVVGATEDEAGYTSDWQLTAYTVCADGAAGFTSVFASSPSNSESKSATVSCPPGAQVHSAGGVLIAGAAAR